MAGAVKIRHWKRWGTWGLVGVGVVILYGTLCWLWHSRHQYTWIPAHRFHVNFPGGLNHDPFAYSDSEKILNRLLINLPQQYRVWTNPYRLKQSPEGEPYFPHSGDVFDTGTPSDYITAYLRRMEEPSLMERKSTDTSRYLRITIERSFDPGLVLCLARGDAKSSLRATILDGSGPHKFGRIGERVHTVPNPEVVRQVFEMAADPEFWQDLSELENAFISSIRDGSTWVFEWSDPDEYHCIQVRSPIYLATEEVKMLLNGEIRDFGPHAEMGTLLLQESGIVVKELY